MENYLHAVQRRIFPIALLAAVLLSALPLAVCAADPEVSFQTTGNYAAGDGPYSVAVGYFNADGIPDLAVTNAYSGADASTHKVTVLLGNGDGSFRSEGYYHSIPYPYGLAVGDFDNDYNPDLAVSTVLQGRVYILLGKGDGTFQHTADYRVGDNPFDVAVADFNGDGKLDLATANFAHNSVSVLLGKGDGTFDTVVNYGAGAAPFSVAVDDFNVDGKPDLAVANSAGNNVSVLLGKGDGTFHTAVNYGAGTEPRSVAAGDFDGDGKPDLAVANASSNSVSVLLGNGDGTFQAKKDCSVGTKPNSIAVSDFNGDGKSDVAVANLDSNNVSVLVGKGDGTFLAKNDYSVGNQPQDIAVGDFRWDGRPDLVTANYGSGNVTTLLNNFPGLSNLTVSGGTLAPSFNTSTLVYTVNVPNFITMLDLTPTMFGSSDQLTINDQPHVNGEPKTISLAVGENTVNIKVNNLSGGGTRTYRVIISRAAADQTNADLFKLETSTGVMTPSFDPDELNYRVEVDNHVASLSITARPAESEATMTINGQFLGSGERTVNVNLNPGDNLMPVIVKSKNGSVTKTYIITIVRGLSGNARLQSLSAGSGVLDPAFDPQTVAYAVKNAGTLQQIVITAVAQEPEASLTVNYSQPAVERITETVRLEHGANLIPIVVTAPNGLTQQSYVLSVNGTVSDADLNSLAVDPGNLIFDSDVVSYNVTVNDSVSSLNLTAAPHDPKALVLVNGSMLSGGGTTVNLSHGVNTIEVMVVAQDASTKIYTVTVTRGYPAITWTDGNLTASAITAYGLTLTWPSALSDAGITGYEVYQGTELIASLPGTARSYNVAGLSAGTTYTFTVKAKDSGGNTGPDLTVNVKTIYDTSPSIDTTDLGTAIIGTAYNVTLAASGGNAPYTWRASGLPAGLSIDTSTGVIGGVPAAAGTSVVNITLTDSLGAATTRGYTLPVFYPAGTGRYIVTPFDDVAVYTVGATPEGFATMTVKDMITGFKYFTVDISLTESHAGDETVVFVQTRKGMQIAINATTADFDTVSRAKAAFNVLPGDVIKVYLVDDLNNSEGFNPTLLQ